MEDIIRAIEDFRREWRSVNPYILAHTSGSTGKPKTIRLAKSDMAVSARATLAHFGINRESRIAAALSPEYIAGKMMIVRGELAACGVVPVPVESCPDLSHVGHLDILAIVPAQIDGVLRQSADIANLLIGGAPMDEVQRAAVVASGICAWESYGMTETCSHVALRRVTDDLDSPFIAMPGISFATDTRGCLRILSDEFSWRELVTNDCVELIDARSFRWKGRFDNVIISGGLKLHPEILEKEYAPALGGRNFYVCGRPDAKWGTAVVLVVEGDSIEGLDKKIASVVADRRRLPKAIIYKSGLPRTPNGKIIRTC